MVGPYTGGQQGLHGIDMAALAGRDQRRAAVAVGALQIGAVRQRHAQYLQAAQGTGQQIGTVLQVILEIGVGPMDQQRARDFHMVAAHGQQQRRIALPVTHIDRCAALEPVAYLQRFAGLGGRQQRGTEFRAIHRTLLRPGRIAALGGCGHSLRLLRLRLWSLRIRQSRGKTGRQDCSVPDMGAGSGNSMVHTSPPGKHGCAASVRQACPVAHEAGASHVSFIQEL